MQKSPAPKWFPGRCIAWQVYEGTLWGDGSILYNDLGGKVYKYVKIHPGANNPHLA